MNAPDLSHEIRQASMQARIDRLVGAMQAVASEMNEFGEIVSSEKYDWFLRMISTEGCADPSAPNYNAGER